MSTVLDRVRIETGALHKEVERILLPEGTREMTRANYIRFLQVQFHFHRLAEPHFLSSSFSRDERWSSFERRKLHLLHRDLTYLGHIPLTKTTDISLPSDEFELLGWAYVSEGSTLGGQVMAKHFSSLPFFHVEKCGKFLSGNGPLTGKAWKSFLGLFQEKGEEKKEMVAKGARNGFEAFLSLAKQVKQEQKSIKSGHNLT